MKKYKYKLLKKESGMGNMPMEGNQVSMMNSANIYGTEGIREDEIVCRNLRKETGTCKTGCIGSKVQKGHDCPYEVGKEQAGKCPCFRI